MSLVNEALKRARTQAAVQQAANAPLSHVVTPVHYSETKRSLSPAIWITALAVILIAMVCISLLYVAKAHTQKSVQTTLAEPTIVVASAPVVQPRVSLPVPPAPPEGATQAVSAAPPSLTQSDPQPAVAPTPTPSATTGINTTPTQPTSAAVPAGLVEGKVYMQAIDFPDVPKVKLDGILWSDKNPVAIINGISSTRGDDLDGVTVVAIEPKRVKLGVQGKEFFLRLP